MRIGFVGAGKAGSSIGKHLTTHGIEIEGYYSRTPQSSKEVAEFTGSKQYLELGSLVADCDLIFVSVTDGAIAEVWEQLKQLPIQNKIIAHFSGSLSSAVFEGIEDIPAYGYSIHPLFAISDKFESYKELGQAFFAIEGAPEHLEEMRQLFAGLGNRVEIHSKESKTRYHAAASISANLYVGIVKMCQDMLKDCGFSEEGAAQALSPLILGNIHNIINNGPVEALTGPIERGDVETVREHLKWLSDDEKEIYLPLSRAVVEIAKQKNPYRNYKDMEDLLNQ